MKVLYGACSVTRGSDVAQTNSDNSIQATKGSDGLSAFSRSCAVAARAAASAAACASRAAVTSLHVAARRAHVCSVSLGHVLNSSPVTSTLLQKLESIAARMHSRMCEVISTSGRMPRALNSMQAASNTFVSPSMSVRCLTSYVGRDASPTGFVTLSMDSLAAWADLAARGGDIALLDVMRVSRLRLASPAAAWPSTGGTDGATDPLLARRRCLDPRAPRTQVQQPQLEPQPQT